MTRMIISHDPSRRYYRAKFGMTFTIIAKDLEDARRVLIGAHESMGESFADYVVDLGPPEFEEIPPERVAAITVHDDYEEHRRDLNTYPIGAWFSSEY